MRYLLLTLLAFCVLASFAVAAQLDGTVIDDEGESVGRAQVSIYTLSNDRRTNRQSIELIARTSTAADGSFSFENIRHSRVIVYAYKPGVGRAVLRMNLNPQNRPIEIQLENLRSRRVRIRPNQG